LKPGASESMGEAKLERAIRADRRFFLYDYPLQGFSLRFVSGPDLTKEVKPGSWLDTWENTEKIRFSFGPKRTLAFRTKEAAVAVQKELDKAVDIITEVVE
jgi:hypothetical protein